MTFRTESPVDYRRLLQWRETQHESLLAAAAKVLHDVVGQELVALRFALMEIKAVQAGDTTDGPLQSLDAALAGLRLVGMRLRPGVLDGAGIGPALQWRASELRRAHGIECDATRVSPLLVSADLATVLYRLADRALEGLLEAGAREVRLGLWREKDTAFLKVAHNAATWWSGEEQKDLNIAWIAERCAGDGGSAVFRSPASGGSLLAIQLPIQERSAR
jgi:signal transduction histidine kinase